MITNKVFFIGGFEGIVKKECAYKGQKFYILSFGVGSEQNDNKFGGQSVNVSVSKEVYEDFKNNAKPWNYVNANISYVRGGWSLFYYEL